MPRIRTLKPEHKQHRKVGMLTHRQYRLWVGMITEADDDGRLCADAAQLRALVFAYHPSVSVRHVVDDLASIAAVGLIRLYRDGETVYADLPSWRDHQRLDRAHYSPSKLPSYNNSTTGSLPIDSEETPGSQGREGNLTTHGREGIVLAGASETPPPADTNESPSAAMIEALMVVDRCPAFRASARLRDETFWLHEIRANPDIDVLEQTLKAQAWLTANPSREKRRVERFLHSWFANPLARRGDP